MPDLYDIYPEEFDSQVESKDEESEEDEEDK